MLIEYLKDAPLGKKGQIVNVQDYEGKTLTLLGFAKKIDLLLNKNGTAVVDDYGSLIIIGNGEKLGRKGKKGK
ncbi:hypothetical protein [Acinetobacter seifertii]|uniref:hypothetical protein n=1 Tax=Acinetobacter seifertii TaxID=1530123 RepID=UPI000A3034F1|nr:hypothetical protein [Acinetobacter seifertii]OUC67322.1 hypothetical protein MWQ_00115 [Acinetobacter seifertii]